MPHADLDGLSLYYERAGSGEPELLFVPGWCCDHTAFRPQFEYFAPEQGVTAVDLRGVGRSDAPGGGYSIPNLTDDVAALCAAVGIERPVVVGHKPRWDDRGRARSEVSVAGPRARPGRSGTDRPAAGDG